MQKKHQNEVLGKLQKIENLLEKKKTHPLNTAETTRYLNISLSHLYHLTSKRKIPFHKPNGKHIYFFENELDEWIVSTSQSESITTKLNNQELLNITMDDEENEPP